jgi:hypothetical protein
MRKIAKIAIFSAALGVAGCAGLGGSRPAPGDSVDTVRLKLGQPTAVYSAGPEQLLEYARGPMGKQTWMAHIGADGRLTAYEPVLTDEKFATIKVGQATKDDVLRTIGRPAETGRVAMHHLEVWTYRYQSSGIWNSMMHVHFDRDGVVRLMQSGPDLWFEDRPVG